MKKIILDTLVLLFILISNQTVGQNVVNVSVGAGLPELYNVGLRFQLKQAQIGFAYGTLLAAPEEGEKIYSLSGDIFLHFGGSSKLTERKPWYFRFGLTYLRDETIFLLDRYSFLNTRIGRDFNISSKIGLDIDLGAIFMLVNKETRKTNSTGLPFEEDFPVLPSFGMSLFYRI